MELGKWSFNNFDERINFISLLPKRIQSLIAIEWVQTITADWAKFYPRSLFEQTIDLANEYIVSVADLYHKLRRQSDIIYKLLNETNHSTAHYRAINAVLHATSAAVFACRTVSRSTRVLCCVARVANIVAETGVIWSWLQSTYERTKGPFDPNWRTTTAVQLAKQILISKELECMPILADALQDAGFSDASWLTYLQTGRDEWVRSNWLVWNLLELDTEKPVE